MIWDVTLIGPTGRRSSSGRYGGHGIEAETAEEAAELYFATPTWNDAHRERTRLAVRPREAPERVFRWVPPRVAHVEEVTD